jgi:hypothetical protein
MNSSILTDTKKVLGVPADYTVFDLDIIMHINSALGVLEQLGIGPNGGFAITSNADTWAVLGLPTNQLNMVRSLIYLKTRLVFDPPATSFHLDAANKQIEQLEWRLNVNREAALHPLGES